MFVRDHMVSPAITVTPDIPFQDALKIMQENHFRRLPVVDKKGKLVGIVSERDLLYASPSPATTLSVWELTYVLSKIQVEELMTKQVVTTTPDTPIEDAASLMVENKVGGLPVVDEANRPVGIITDRDIFKAFVEMVGGGQPGLRLTLSVPHGKGVLAGLSRAITDLGGYIVSFGSFPIPDKPDQDGLVVKVQDISRSQLVDTLEGLGDHVVDAREV
ncbi:MAG: CBS domain-containing protein [Anaerolineae bacterium]|nr:CBS domain-containing protein [Anaerolineae bacterium]